jgi:hypothetical protein
MKNGRWPRAETHGNSRRSLQRNSSFEESVFLQREPFFLFAYANTSAVSHLWLELTAAVSRRLALLRLACRLRSCTTRAPQGGSPPVLPAWFQRYLRPGCRVCGFIMGAGLTRTSSANTCTH